VSASALTCTGMPSLQTRADELTGSLTSSCDTARNASQKARRPRVEAALVIGLRFTCVVTRTEMFGDDLVQELCHASIGVARRLLEARFRGGRDAPSVYFALAWHALQCNAILGVNAKNCQRDRGRCVLRRRGLSVTVCGVVPRSHAGS